MYPGTQFNWIDQSFIQEEVILTENTAPLFMGVGSFNKGPEEFRTVYGEEFTRLYGESDFFAHGQNSIQLKNIINNGGRLFLKRVVAPDSTLANLVIVAKVKAVQKMEQRTDELGNLLYYTDDTLTEITTEKTDYKVMDAIYLDQNGDETTEVTDTPVNVASISYESKSFENIKSDEDNLYSTSYKKFKDKALQLLSDEGDEAVYPLFIVADTGRGTSPKAIRVTPDYNVSRGSGFMFYNFEVLEGTNKIESQMFTANPDVIYSNTSYRLGVDTCEQLNGFIDEEVFNEFVARVAEISGLNAEELRNNDIIFGKLSKGSDIEEIVIDSESVDLQATTGIVLAGGSNGAFGDKPASKDEGNETAYKAWTDAIRAVYAGEITDEIYDVDQQPICAILDANFPAVIKEAIGELVVFRQDCVFFRDCGTGLRTFSEIRAAHNELPGLNREDRKFIADFVTSYEIKDPNTQKNIEVTCLYDLASILPNHFENNFNAPTAGTYNGFVLPSAIKGTVNYTPINTPKANMKQAMEDLHANYAIFEGDQCVMQSSYTAQDTLSQLSFLNNVLAIQSVMRAVRRACPANRFSLSNGSDLTSYATAVQDVLDDYKGRFDILEFEYTANSLMAQQKIFYASIRFAFLNWAQSEVFDLYAINNE